MNEKPPEYVPGFLRDMTKRDEKEELLELLKGLTERQESFPFSGLEEEVYAKMKADEKLMDEYPGYATPIDDLIKRLEASGCKVVVGGSSDAPTAFIIPGDSTDVDMDSVLPGSLKINEGMDPELKQLVLRDKYKMNAPKGTK